MRVRLTRVYQIACAHQLHGLREGHKCGRMHGHNYRIEITLSADELDLTGMVLDAEHVDTSIAPVLKRLDHHTLNECDDGTPAGARMAAQPTAENIALYLWERLAFMSRGDRYRMTSVRVHENDRLYAEVRAQEAA